MINKLTHEHIIALLITLDKELDDYQDSNAATASEMIIKNNQKNNDTGFGFSVETPTYLRDKREKEEVKPVSTRKTRRVELLKEVQEYVNSRLSSLSFELDIDSKKEENALN